MNTDRQASLAGRDLRTRHLGVRREGAVVTVAMNRLERRNALHAASRAELAAVFDAYAADLAAEAKRWTGALLAAASRALRATKRMRLRGLAQGSVEAAFAATCPAYEVMLISEDAREGMPAFIDKRSPAWRGR